MNAPTHSAPAANPISALMHFIAGPERRCDRDRSFAWRIGARLVTAALNQLERIQGRYALCSHVHRSGPGHRAHHRARLK